MWNFVHVKSKEDHFKSVIMCNNNKVKVIDYYHVFGYAWFGSCKCA